MHACVCVYMCIKGVHFCLQGGVVGLEIDWSCDHLESGLDSCNPKYSAKR